MYWQTSRVYVQGQTRRNAGCRKRCPPYQATLLIMHDREDDSEQSVFLPNPSFQEVKSDAKGIAQCRIIRIIEFGAHLSPPGCQPFNQVMIPTPISTTPTIDT